MFETKLAFLTFAFFFAGQGSSSSSEECTLVTRRSNIYRSDVCKGLNLSTNGGKMAQIWSEVDERGHLVIQFEAFQVINESTTSMKFYLQNRADRRGKTEDVNSKCEMKDSLRFHPKASRNVKFTNEYRTAGIKERKYSDPAGVVFSNRPLLPNEMFGVQLTNMIQEEMLTISIGVTGMHPETVFLKDKKMKRFTDSDLPKAGFWNNHYKINDESSPNDRTFHLNDLKENNTVGVARKLNGELHLYVNGQDMGDPIKYDKPEIVYGYIDILPGTLKVTFMDQGFV